MKNSFLVDGEFREIRQKGNITFDEVTFFLHFNNGPGIIKFQESIRQINGVEGVTKYKLLSVGD